MEQLFDLEMISLFSWSGLQKCKSAAKKKSFRSNTNIVDLIHEVLRSADSSWDQLANEGKLQAYLKHPKTNRGIVKQKASASDDDERGDGTAASPEAATSDEQNRTETEIKVKLAGGSQIDVDQ